MPLCNISRKAQHSSRARAEGKAGKKKGCAGQGSRPSHSSRVRPCRMWQSFPFRSPCQPILPSHDTLPSTIQQQSTSGGESRKKERLCRARLTAQPFISCPSLPHVAVFSLPFPLPTHTAIPRHPSYGIALPIIGRGGISPSSCLAGLLGRDK